MKNSTRVLMLCFVVLVVGLILLTTTGCADKLYEPLVQGTSQAPAPEPTMLPSASLLGQLRIDDRPESARSSTPYRAEDWAFTDFDGNGCRDDYDAEGIHAIRREGCRPIEGGWTSLYDGAFHSRASEMDVDHVVARKDAHLSGGASWDARRRAEFVGLPQNLQPVTSRVNSAKGERGPDEWPFAGGVLAVKGSPQVNMAPGALCTYALIYTGVKARFELSVTTAQRDALGRYLATC